MRLSTREVNMQGRLSKSPKEHDWSTLLTSADAWPPLLPSFSAETVEAVDRFIQSFICKRIECRCGQLPASEYTASYLPQWIAMAGSRTALMEDFFAQHGARLEEATFRCVFGAFERLQSALRDARQDCAEVDEEERHDKKITFARPVAHRLIRRSRDRFSLRSVADADDSFESTRLSTSPRVFDVADVLRSSLQRASLSPLPCDDALMFDAECDEGPMIVLPVEESSEGDHFTGRASGVYYGDIVHAVRSPDVGPTDGASDGAERLQGARSDDACGEPVEPLRAMSTAGASYLANESPANLANACRGPSLHTLAWRRWWLILFYYVLLPLSVAWYLLGNQAKSLLFPGAN